MKIVKQFTIQDKYLSLIRGNLFFDNSIQVYVTTPKLFQKNAKRFGLSHMGFEVLGENYLAFYQEHNSIDRPLRQKFINWLLADSANLVKVTLNTINLDGVIILPARNILLQPSLVQIDEKFVIFVAEDDQNAVTYDDVKKVFLKILKVASQAKLNPLGTVPFGQSHIPEAVQGIVGAITEFEGSSPKEINIYEVDLLQEHQIFPALEAELIGLY